MTSRYGHGNAIVAAAILAKAIERIVNDKQVQSLEHARNIARKAQREALAAFDGKERQP